MLSCRAGRRLRDGCGKEEHYSGGKGRDSSLDEIIEIVIVVPRFWLAVALRMEVP